MLPLVFSDEGSIDMLEAYFKGRSLTLKLFSNDYTPTDLSTVANFTEVTGGEYSAITLDPDDCTVVSVDGLPTAVYPLQEFSMPSALPSNQLVHGYYVINGTKLVCAQKETTPFTPGVSGTIYSVLPKFLMSNGVVTK